MSVKQIGFKHLALFAAVVALCGTSWLALGQPRFPDRDRDRDRAFDRFDPRDRDRPFPGERHDGRLRGFVEVDRIFINADHPKQSGPVVFFNTATGDGLDEFPEGRWITIDATRHGIPPSARAVALTTTMLITHGQEEGTANLTLQVKTHGVPPEQGNYHAQAVEAHVGGGQRTNDFVLIPLRDGKFDVLWEAEHQAPYPQGSAYGINMSINAFFL